jgi:transposase-like protein
LIFNFSLLWWFTMKKLLLSLSCFLAIGISQNSFAMEDCDAEKDILKHYECRNDQIKQRAKIFYLTHFIVYENGWKQCLTRVVAKLYSKLRGNSPNLWITWWIMKKTCPNIECENHNKTNQGLFVKIGYFKPKTTNQKTPRYKCKACKKNFSTHTDLPSANQKKPKINQELFKLLVSGVSLRRASELLDVSKSTVRKK